MKGEELAAGNRELLLGQPTELQPMLRRVDFSLDRKNYLFWTWMKPWSTQQQNL
jgi:hypothetical protein